MAEHTPGPLTVSPIPDSMASVYIRDRAGNAIGAAFAGGVSSNGATFPAEANARLWAVSPTMYLYIAKKAAEGDSEAVGLANYELALEQAALRAVEDGPEPEWRRE